MLVTIATALLFVEFKSWLERIWAENQFWNKWEVRFMVLLSLCLQLVLVRLGKQRKYTATPWVSIGIWSAYLLADWLATVSLSTLLKSKEGLSKELIVFWTPFLLLHLGGPDTITAYCLADNELWLRHLLGLAIQVGTACYVYYRFRTKSPLQFMAIPIFIAGIIKYGERIWILRSASSKEFANSVFSAASGKKTLNPDAFLPNPVDDQPNHPEKLEDFLCREKLSPETHHIYESFLSFKMFTPLFSELPLRIYHEVLHVFIRGQRPVDVAFYLVDTELEFLYDVLYTKISLLHTPMGGILRFICFLGSISALIAFSVIFKQNKFAKIDIAITYLLLTGAIFLDIYAAISNVCSHWAVLWTINYGHLLPKFVNNTFLSLSPATSVTEGLTSMAQHNLLDYCVKTRMHTLTKVMKILDTGDLLQRYWHTTWIDVSLDLKQFIYSHLLEKYKRYEAKKFGFETLKNLLDERGDHALGLRGTTVFEEIGWTTKDVEFNHSLLLWHIATDLCYYEDFEKYGDIDLLGPNCEISQRLSDYMSFLVVARPFMLPKGKGISEVRYKDTCEEAMNFFTSKSELRRGYARLALLSRVDYAFSIRPITNKSVLYGGYMLHKKLQDLEVTMQWDIEEKWRLISEVWIEMLMHAASHCAWKEHAHQLRHGKELLTHVSLLMVHLGLTPLIQVTDSKNIQDMGFSPPWQWKDLAYLPYYLC